MGVVANPATDRRDPGRVLWFLTGIGWLTMIALMLVPAGMWGMPSTAAAALTEQMPGLPTARVLAVFLAAWVVIRRHSVVPLDENNSDEQNAAIVRMLHGELGGPLHELTKLLRELVAIEKAPPLLHQPTELRHTALAPLLGDPLYPGRVKRHHIHDPRYAMEFTAHQSSQTNIRYVWL